MSKKQGKTNSAGAIDRGTAFAANADNPPVEKETKAATIIKLLINAEGATLEQMMAATGWQKHSVRGFMAGTLKKKHGLTVLTTKVDGSRTYRVESAGTQS